MDFFRLIEKVAYSSVVVKSVDYVRNVLAHINVNEPITVGDLRVAIGQVGCEDLVDNIILVSLGELIGTVGEETKGGKCEDALNTLLLELICNVEQ